MLSANANRPTVDPRYRTVLEDPSRRLTIVEVSGRKRAQRFRQTPEHLDTMKFGMTASTCWLRPKARNATPHEKARRGPTQRRTLSWSAESSRVSR